MRVVICVDEFPKLSETFVLDHVRVLKRNGYEVQVIANRPSGELSSHAEAKALLPLVSFRGTSRVRRWGATAARALGALRTLPVTDILHCHFGPVGLQHVATRNRGTRLVVSFHGYDLIQFPRRHGDRIYEPLFASADLVLSNTEYGRACLLNLGCPENKIGILPLGIDISRFTFRKRVWRGEPVVLATVARLVEKKGIDVALRAVARLVKRYPHLRYHILGDGPLHNSLQELAATLGLQDAVVFKGWQSRDQLVQVLDRAHLLVLPSVMAHDGDVDTQGLVVQEAQAMGLPVIVSRTGGLAEGVAEGLSGYVVTPGDPLALAERIEFLFNHPERWPEMGAHGRAFVSERYSLDRFVERLDTLYRALTTEATRV
ncbi:MAG: glycosyltransferase [bacterium]